MTLMPREAVVQAARTPQEFVRIVSGQDPSTRFWGRGVASTWTLYLEPDEVTGNEVDLSQLQRIELVIGYRALLLP